MPELKLTPVEWRGRRADFQWAVSSHHRPLKAQIYVASDGRVANPKKDGERVVWINQAGSYGAFPISSAEVLKDTGACEWGWKMHEEVHEMHENSDKKSLHQPLLLAQVKGHTK